MSKANRMDILNGLLKQLNVPEDRAEEASKVLDEAVKEAIGTMVLITMAFNPLTGRVRNWVVAPTPIKPDEFNVVANALFSLAQHVQKVGMEAGKKVEEEKKKAPLEDQ